jgi:hypothetical protein
MGKSNIYAEFKTKLSNYVIEEDGRTRMQKFFSKVAIAHDSLRSLNRRVSEMRVDG